MEKVEGVDTHTHTHSLSLSLYIYMKIHRCVLYLFLKGCHVHKDSKDSCSKPNYGVSPPVRMDGPVTLVIRKEVVKDETHGAELPFIEQGNNG